MSHATTPTKLLIIGVGAIERGDDAVGRMVVRRVRNSCPDAAFQTIELRGEATELMDAWAAADTVLLIDAASTGMPPGTLNRFDASRVPLPAEMAKTSTHDVGVSDAIELARAMGMLPDRVIVFAIEVQEFTHGSELSPAVQQAINEAADAVIHEANNLTKGSHRYA